MKPLTNGLRYISRMPRTIRRPFATTGTLNLLNMKVRFQSWESQILRICLAPLPKVPNCVASYAMSRPGETVVLASR